jgi:hypothetical protein
LHISGRGDIWPTVNVAGVITAAMGRSLCTY